MYEEPNPPSPACFIGEGTLISKKDMMRALETLEGVQYSYRVDDKTISDGAGIVVRVFASDESSTLILNGCLFLNVVSFDYLRFYPDARGTSTVELVSGGSNLNLSPIDEGPQPQARMLKHPVGRLNYGPGNFVPLIEDFSDEEED